MNRVLHALLLIFSFLFAQAGLAAHAAEHVATASHSNDQGLAAEGSCELCVGYAQLAGAAPMPQTPAMPVVVARHEVPAAGVGFFVTSTTYFSRARAPPVFS